MFEELILNIEKMFSKDSEEISKIIKTLSDHEKEILENELNNVAISKKTYSNIDINKIVKALNIIIDIINNRSNIKNKNVIIKINNIIFELYKLQYDLIDNIYSDIEIDYIIVMYAMYAMVCDKETMVDKNKNKRDQKSKDRK